ncbi:phasin family protein [Rhizobium halophytocola]|uniref:Phasin family protein n=1 Tax=Rhizobium halophytocola TaxID=735519 RepID=A0ABS4DUL3_9HYPH|nr:phasin family protein [Rhizobium halophytocola]MBP1849388.1 hypothetical protein [Rhizobium halophytocola]
MTLKIDGSFPDFADVPGFAGAQNLMRNTMRMQVKAFEAAMRCQIEALDFLKRRYAEDIKLMNDLAQSTETKDTFDVMSNFVQNATVEYADETGKIATIGSKLVSETAERVRGEAVTAFEDMAVKTVG